MPAIAEDIVAFETAEMAAAEQPLITTTLYDLIADLQENVEPWEDNLVTSAVADLCNSKRLHFINLPGNSKLVCV
jgi:hypothetical protein